MSSNRELQAQNKQLRAEIDAIEQQTLETNYIKEQIFKIADAKPVIPEWTWNVSKTPKGAPGVPTLFWSDWHYTEVVEPGVVNGVNSFNKAIFDKRLKTLVDKSLNLLRGHIVNPNYPGVVVALGGDMISGEIHPELMNTNSDPVIKGAVDLAGKLVVALSRIADEFGKVFVPCVVGNHGRNTRKPEHKLYVYKNFDWLIYTMAQKMLAGDKRFTFQIGEARDTLYRIYNTRYLLTHGDQFKGGSGIAGMLSPMMIGDAKKRKRATAINMSYDYMIMGHWHQLAQFKNIIVNGSIKGYDEYAMDNNFDYELPQQAMWITHHTLGINYWIPLQLEERKIKAEQEWVSWKG